MSKRSDFLGLTVVTILFSYAIAIGTTFNGILTPEFHFTTLTLIALTVIIWLFVHWRRGWVWHSTVLDGVFVLWGIAFGVSLLANLDTGRRIAIGLWYMSAYIGLWYILWDVVANNGIRREILVDGFLISGVVVLIFGYLQCREWLLSTLPLITAGLLPFNLPRPVSTLGNANLLSCFLVVLIPFILTRALNARTTFNRIGLGIYGFLALLLLFLTYSRGAWLGLAAGLLIWGLLTLWQRNLFSIAMLRGWWVSRPSFLKITLVAVFGIFTLGVLTAGLLFIRSFQQPTRSADLRINIYKAAIALFSEKPLTGQGLYTFGRGLARMQSMPPETPHGHAHNAILHIAAELGIPGLIALFVTLGVIVWVVRRNWREMSFQSRSVLTASAGAVVGFAIHHMTDVPATEPTIALVGLVALFLLLIPLHPRPLSGWRRIGHPYAMAGLWIVLLGTGWWSSRVYSDYASALVYGTKTEDFRGAASLLQPVVDAEPSLTLYRMQQAYFWGLAASEGDNDAARQAIAEYRTDYH